MKTYKTWEVIKMLTENSKLMFKSNGDQIGIIDNSLVWLSSCKEVHFTLDCPMHIDMFNKDWALVQRPVTFMEAMKAYNRGATVRHDGEFPHSYRYTNGDMRDEDNACISIEEIINDNWFIEDSEPNE